MDRETAIEMILDPGRRPAEGTPQHQEFLACLEESPDCRAMYQQQQAVWQALDVWEPAEPSAGFDRALFEKIERSREDSWTSRWGWLTRPGEWLGTARPSFAAGLAALLLIAGTVLTYQPTREGDGAAVQTPAPVETEYIQQIDQALDDIEMLADFEALALAAESPGRS
jgi:hypothetical protein